MYELLHKVSFDEIAPFLSKSYYAGRRCDYLKELIENPVFEGFLMCKDSKIVAVCLGRRRSWWRGKEFFVDEFFVETGRQGNGIGTKTVDFLVNTLQDLVLTQIGQYAELGLAVVKL